MFLKSLYIYLIYFNILFIIILKQIMLEYIVEDIHEYLIKFYLYLIQMKRKL